MKKTSKRNHVRFTVSTAANSDMITLPRSEYEIMVYKCAQLRILRQCVIGAEHSFIDFDQVCTILGIDRSKK